MEGIISQENLFLIILGLVWIIGAVIQDLKRREVDNIWNFSLIGIALAYRLGVSVFTGNYWFILNGLIGFAVFFALGNLFYYSRLFAGGDAKLLYGIGAILPFSYDWIVNLKIFGGFHLLFLAGGSIYAIVYAFILISMNFKRFSYEFKKEWKNYNKMFLIALIFAALWILIALFISKTILILIGLVVLLFPVLFVFAKAVENGCLIREVNYDKVTIGDWLYKDIKLGKKTIRADWQGISEEELSLIRKYKKKVMIKYGIEFTPSFLIGFLGILFLAWKFPGLF